jgi:hypothetical protein
MRSLEGLGWLESLSSEVGKRVYCAADFMGRPKRLLETQPREFYATMPVRAGTGRRLRAAGGVVQWIELLRRIERGNSEALASAAAS